ncbi:MAG: A/G-specific adenine glycosylase [archaeon]
MDFPSQELMEWFQKNQRPLPWRKAYDPYHVWISEIMAQQTRIDQMQPYYARFLKQFPNVHALADADPQTVLKSWEGLGYYSRARNLHDAAKQVVEKHKGELPHSQKELEKLKGFGPYISSAVASIAFNENVPVVDGNVLRVTTRFWGISEDVSLPKTREKINAKLNEVLPQGKARAFNQGLMELGALICVPDNPLCSTCPLQKECFAYRYSKQSSFPVKAKKGKAPQKHFAMAAIRQVDSLGFVQRQTALLNGMWECPMVEYSPLTDSTYDIEKKFEEMGIRIKIGTRKGEVKHSYSHFTQHVHVFEATLTNSTPSTLSWFDSKKLEKKPLSKVQLRVLELLKK